MENGIPFSNKLIHSEVAPSYRNPDKLNELDNNPDKVIRIENRDVLNERYGGKFDVIELAQIAKSLYDELKDGYGIETPADFLVGKDKNDKDAIYSVVDKIDGKKLGELENSEELAEKIKSLYASIARYFLDKYQNGGNFLVDINSSDQYVYGKKPGGSKNEIYLIDTDLYFHNAKTAIFTAVEWLTRHMKSVEIHFGISLHEARNYVEELINLPLPEGISDKTGEKIELNISGIRKFLNNEELGPGSGPAIPPH